MVDEIKGTSPNPNAERTSMDVIADIIDLCAELNRMYADKGHMVRAHLVLQPEEDVDAG